MIFEREKSNKLYEFNGGYSFKNSKLRRNSLNILISSTYQIYSYLLLYYIIKNYICFYSFRF